MAEDKEGRAKAIDIALSQIEKQFGKGSIMKLGSREAVDVPTIPTGSISIDAALGVGGLPRGRVIEIFGPESSGKTTLALHAIAEAQKRGGMAAFIDAEHALDAIYAKALGVNIDELLVSQPDSGEQALEIAEVLIRSGAVDVLVIDSVAALVPKAELDGEMGDAQMGLQARLMSQAMRKLTAIVSKSKTCLIFINQIREKIGVMFGNPETTTGGRALKFYSSIRIDIRRIAAIKEGEEVVGNRTRVKVVKNKVAAPFREAEFDILYGRGISREGDLLDVAAEKNIIEKSGAWYSYNNERIGQGRENARRFLIENSEIAAKLEERPGRSSCFSPWAQRIRSRLRERRGRRVSSTKTRSGPRRASRRNPPRWKRGAEGRGPPRAPLFVSPTVVAGTSRIPRRVNIRIGVIQMTTKLRATIEDPTKLKAKRARSRRACPIVADRTVAQSRRGSDLCAPQRVRGRCESRAGVHR
jgi:recombination protein RecA